MKLKIICFLIFSTISTISFSQFEEKGVLLGLGFGIGFSSYGGSYYIQREGPFGNSNREFSGFRAIVVDAKLGYKINEKIAVYGKMINSPSNTTISPYSATWLGGNVAVGLPGSDSFYVFGGAGRHSAKVTSPTIKLSKSILYNGGLGLRVGNSLIFDLNVFVGPMETENDLLPNPFVDVDKEFLMTLTFNYLIPIGGSGS